MAIIALEHTLHSVSALTESLAHVVVAPHPHSKGFVFVHLKEEQSQLFSCSFDSSVHTENQ